MQIEVKETEYCKINVHYESDAEEIETKRNEVLNQFKKAPIKGVRSGSKTSLEMIKMQYQKQINESLKRALAELAFHNTLFEKDIKPFGAPNFTNLTLLANKFSCDFTMNKKPDFELAPYKEITFPKQPINISVEDLTQQMLQELRVRHGGMALFTADDTVQLGDSVTIDYHAFDGEVNLDTLNGAGEILTVGKIALPGFDDAIIGMKIDETRSFDILIPEGGLPSVVGKNIKFEVKLVAGSKNTPMPLNDELAIRAGKENYQQLMDAVAASASMRYTEAARGANVKQLSARLLNDNDIKIPSWLTLSEAQYLASNANLKWDLMAETDREGFLKTAEANVKLALILDKIREDELEAQLSDQEVLEMIKGTIGKSNGQDPEQALANLNQNGYLAILVARIRDEYALDFILKNAIITE
jgi:trigger factor